MRTQFAVLTGLVCAMCINGATRQPVEPEGYEVDEAYQVYNVLLPDEESYKLAKSTLVIQQDTVQSSRPFGSCLTREAEKKFKDAIADFARLNRRRWILQRKFELAKPYEVVPRGLSDCHPSSALADLSWCFQLWDLIEPRLRQSFTPKAPARDYAELQPTIS